MSQSNENWWAVPDGVDPTDPLTARREEAAIPLSLLSHDLYAYADGYKTAADAVLREAMESPGSKNLLAHPVVFLYRHYLELALKDIIILGRQLYGKLGNVNPYKNHRIDLLWAEAEKYITEAFPDPDTTGYLDMAEATIVRFGEVDPKSFNFRYPVDTDGAAILLPNIWVGLQNLKISMDHVEQVLYGVASHLDELLSLRCSEL